MCFYSRTGSHKEQRCGTEMMPPSPKVTLEMQKHLDRSAFILAANMLVVRFHNQLMLYSMYTLKIRAPNGLPQMQIYKEDFTRMSVYDKFTDEHVTIEKASVRCAYTTRILLESSERHI